MSELNEAYEALSDAKKRFEFDQIRERASRGKDSFFTSKSQRGRPPFDKDSDWELALRFYPDLKNFEVALGAISWQLAILFRAVLLEGKDFERREKVAMDLESKFYEFHFGSEPSILGLANKLLLSGDRERAAELARIISVLGERVNPHRVLAEFNEEVHPTELPITEEDREQMKVYGIKFDGEVFHFGGYIYKQLSNAIAYARAVYSKGSE